MTTPEKEVGSILLVLKKIMYYLDSSKLVEFRLVNKIWHQVATGEILKRDAVQMKICTTSVQNALKILDWANVPTTHFYFSDRFVDLDLIEEFVYHFSPCVKALTINFESLDLPPFSHLNLENYLLLIRLCSSSIEKLCLHPIFKCYKFIDGPEDFTNGGNQQDLNSSLKLPKLKELNFLVNIDCGNDHALTRGSIGYRLLMDNLDTLETVHGFWLRGVATLDNFWTDTNESASGKNIISIIKSFYFSKKLVNFPDLQNFADAGPKLNKMSLMDFRSTPQNEQFKVPLYKILQSSQNSLATLYSASFLHFSDHNLPVLNNLTTLILTVNENQNLEHYFDLDDAKLFSIQKKCLQLKTVRLLMDWWCRSSEWRNPHFSWSAKRGKKGFLSVENLELVGEPLPRKNEAISPSWWRRLKVLFPEVKRLQLKGTTDHNVVLQEVFFLWPRLKVLEIDIPLVVANENALDSCFTGIPQNMICELEHYKNNFVMDLNEVEKRSPSLCNLTDLRRLDCVLVGDYSEIGQNWRCPFSIISCLYGFSLLPNLEINVRFLQKHVNSPVIREKLDELKDFVNFKAIPVD